MEESIDEKQRIYERDKDLARKAKEGDIGARDELIRLYEPLSIKLGNKFSCYINDKDDLSQDALLYLTKRIPDYDPSISQFITFAYNTMLRYVRKKAIRNRKKVGRLVSLYKTIGKSESYLVEVLEGEEAIEQ